jgi:ABC-type sugar transport systems, ATPase components
MKIILRDVTKSYDGRLVISGFSHEFETGEAYVIEGASGIGKTTLLRIIAGLETCDSGSVVYKDNPKPGFAPVFQETRLVDYLDAVRNIKLACGGMTDAKIKEELLKIIPASELDKKISELSGGTARRVEIVRAILSPSDVLIMDEPLTGLDDKTADLVSSYISDNIGERIFIASSHNKRLCTGAHSLVLR